MFFGANQLKPQEAIIRHMIRELLEPVCHGSQQKHSNLNYLPPHFLLIIYLPLSPYFCQTLYPNFEQKLTKDIAKFFGANQMMPQLNMEKRLKHLSISLLGTLLLVTPCCSWAEKDGLKGSDLEPEYFPEGLFAPDVKHHITVIKHDRNLYLRVENPQQVFYGHMKNSKFPVITEGRIGLRHMFTRSARYRNFRISTHGLHNTKQRVRNKAELEQLVEETHEASLKLREGSLRKAIAKDSYWIKGVWGETLWSLAALYLNEKVDLANTGLLERANDYIALNRADVEISAFDPGKAKETPWSYFAITDYLRILYLFHAKSPHFPGRLKPETEAAMKEALWFWVSGNSRVDDAGLENLFLLLGTENHDLTKRPNFYLGTALLKDDPAYRDRRLADGHTLSEHAAAYTAFFREWPRSRARSGLWVEVGSNTYQKYSWPALFNLHELAPDPVIRKRFGLLLDMAFIEEAQISVRGRRGGGRSRAKNGPNSFEAYKNLLYAPAGKPAGCSHSKVIETSRYQLPAAAILLRKREFPTDKPFVIRNRVLGELDARQPDDKKGQLLASDSALVNYGYRTPHYLLGSTLQNPTLIMPNPETGGRPSLKYAGITRQNRWCGMLFDDPASDEVCAIYPVIERTRGGRPQHPHWSVQHENVLILQRIAPETRVRMGSYSTGAVSIRFHGEGLKKVEKDGWIFASNGKAFAAVKFLDGGYEWDEAQEQARPANFDHATDNSRILIHADDIATQSFDQFQADILANHLKISADKVEYKFGSGKNHIEVTSFDSGAPEKFSLPHINGKPINLRPTPTFQSPYLNGPLDDDQFSVTVGPVSRVLDFSVEGE